MKKIFTILLVVCGTLRIASAQTPTWLWAIAATGGDNYQYGSGAAVDDSGFYYMGGRFAPTVTFGTHSLTTGAPATQLFGKFDGNGNCLWLAQQFYSNGYDYPRGFCIDKAKKNNVYATGLISSGSGMYVVKFNNMGAFQWSTTINGGSGYTTSPDGDGIAADTSGNVYVTGETGGGSGTNWTFGDSVLNYPGTSSSQEMFLTKLDKTGKILWAVGADGINPASDGFDVGRGVTVDKAGQYVFVSGGYYGTPSFHSRNPAGDITAPTQSGSNSTLFIAKYDTGGNLLFVTTAPGAGIPWTGSTFSSSVGASNSIAVDLCDNIFITGAYVGSATFGPFTLTASGANDGFVASCNSKGQWQWANDIGGGGSNSGASIVLDKDNDVYVGGGLTGTANFGYGISATATASGDAFIAKYANSTGAAQWVLTPTGSGASGGGSVAVDTQKFVYFTGSFAGTMTLGTHPITYTGGFGQGIYIAKLDTVPARYIVPVVDSNYCPGSTVDIPYSIIGSFNSGNTFTAQLSDSTGSFVNAVNIGDTTTTNGGIIPITIPGNTRPGTNYLIRVISSNPATSSYVNGCGAYYQKNVYINNFYVTIGGAGVTAKVSNDTTICYGSFVELHASGGTSYAWSPGVTLNDTTSANPIAAPTSPQIYTVIVSSGSCGSDTAKVTVNVNPAANVSVSPANTTACSAASVSLMATGATSYTWTPATGLNCYTCANPIATATVSTTYSVTGNNGACSNTFLDTITIANTAVGGIVTAVRDTICEGTAGNLTLAGNSNGTIEWQSSTDNATFTNVGDTLTKYKTTPLTQTTWYRTTVGSGNCSAVSDNTLELYVPPALVASFYMTGTGANQFAFNSDSSTGNIRSYHWDFGDGGTSTDSNPSHTYAKDSSYYVCLTLYDGSNCSYTYCRYNELGGVPTISAGGSWIIYPNPFSEQLTISAKQINDDIQSVEMYDVLGQLVINKDLGNTTSTSLQLDVSSLAKGMYYVMIRTADADYVQKVVKQ